MRGVGWGGGGSGNPLTLAGANSGWGGGESWGSGPLPRSGYPQKNVKPVHVNAPHMHFSSSVLFREGAVQIPSPSALGD